jgi:hypothetical protein
LLPGVVITGVGVGLVMPSLTGAAVHGLPKERFALGSAVNQAVRQVAAALGVALTIALLTSAPGFSGFQRVFLLVLAGAAATTILALGVRTRPVQTPRTDSQAAA